jgi:hypothetical protein
MTTTKLYRFTARNGNSLVVSGTSKADAKRAAGGSYIKVDVVGHVDAAGHWVYDVPVVAGVS